jgi:hypothetical protein
MKRLVVSFVIVLGAVLGACATGGTAADAPVPGPVSPGPRSFRNYARPLSYEESRAYRTDTADSHMRSIPPNIEASRSTDIAAYVNALAAYIVQTSANEYECVKKAHDWLILNIRYDAVAFLTGGDSVQDYDSVITRKLGLSEGMANVFKALCDSMRIECEIIRGYGRGFGSLPFDQEDPAKSNSAWNMVKIGEGWFFVDCAYDAGYLLGKSYTSRYSTEYLFPEPEYFAYSHFPENPEQQLLEEKISAAAFSDRPYLGPLFFDAISRMNFDIKRLNQAGGKLVMEFSPASGYISSPEVYDGSGGRKLENLSFVQREDEIYRAYFSFPNPGNYVIRYFSKKQDAPRFSLSAEFGVSAAAGSVSVYPIQFPSFGPEVTIVSPLEMPLEQNTAYEFKINAEGNKNVVLIANNRTWNFSRTEEGLFVLNTVIPGNVREIFIGVNKGGNGGYENIAKYIIVPASTPPPPPRGDYDGG